VDIKTAKKEPNELMVKEYAVNADYYVLAHVEKSRVTFYGAAWSEQLTNGVRKESPFGHVNYTVSVDHLDPLPKPGKITSVA